MASVWSVAGQGQRHSFWFYWTLCSSTLNRLGEYCKLASEKIKAIVYKQIQEQDEEKKIEAKEKDENIWNKNIDTVDLFSNVDKLASQKNEEDMLSIVESIVTAKLETEFCINKDHKDQSSTSDNNTKDVIQDAPCTKLSNSQKTYGDPEKLKLKKQFDGNNNDPKSITPCISEVNDQQNSTSKIIGIESNKTSTEVKNKDVHMKTNNTTKTSDTIGSNTNLIKDNEKSYNLNSDSKKAVFNSSKLLNTTDKNGKDQFSNKYKTKNTACIRKQEFVKQRNVSRNGIEKEIKKPNSVKTGFETTDMTCQNKNSNKDKAVQKQTMKQFASKLKGQESLKKNASSLNFFDDKYKTEKVHEPENFDSLNESERKNEKIFQSDQKTNRGDFKKSSQFVMQYKNSTFSKPMQNVPRTGQIPMYGRNTSYAYSNPKFNRNRNSSTEFKVTKKEHAPTNIFTKLDTGIQELDTNNLESCITQKEEIIQPINVKSNVHEDTLVFNDKSDTKLETHLIQSKENVNLRNKDQEPTMSEQCYEKTNDTSIVDISQQHREINNEEISSFKHSSNLVSDKCTTDLQINPMHQYLLKLENMQYTNDGNQLESGQTTWNQSSDNAMQKDATVMSLQQSVQNMHFNTQQIFTQAGNLTRQTSAWEPNNSKFYDQHFSFNDAMRVSQIPNTFNTLPYEYNASMSNDNNVAGTSTSETTMNSNRDNSNVLYRYGPSMQQRPVMTSDLSGHSSCQTNQTRWSSSIQDGFHVEHPYVATQSTMMHVYNPATFGTDDINNTMDYVSHPVIYAPSPYMQTWNSQLQYSMPVLYNSPCTNYTTYPQNNQSNNFNSSVHDQQHKHNPYTQINNYVKGTYNDTNTCAIQTRNTVDNVPIKSNYYYKKYHDNYRAIYNPQYTPISYSRSQQGMNFVPATGINQYNTSYWPLNQKYYKQNVTNYMKNPKGQIQDFTYDDNSSEDAPPIISPKEFVTSNINLSTQADQLATRVKPEFKSRSNSGYRLPPSLPKYNSGFRRNATFQDFSKEYTYPISIGRGTYKTKRT